MPKNLAFVAALSLVVVHDIRTQIHATRAAKVFLEAVKSYDKDKAAQVEQIAYLMHRLEVNGVPVDEFDLIALNYHAE